MLCSNRNLKQHTENGENEQPTLNLGYGHCRCWFVQNESSTTGIILPRTLSLCVETRIANDREAESPDERLFGAMQIVLFPV